MTPLKCNFTNQEQSARLLELGVPAWTADCFYPLKTSDMPIVIADPKVGFNLKYAMPCWSVGRLIEIYCLSAGIEYIKICISEIPQIESMIKMIEIAVTVKTFDFSKLEE